MDKVIYKFEVTIKINNKEKTHERYVLANGFDLAILGLQDLYNKSDDIELVSYIFKETIFPLVV